MLSTSGIKPLGAVDCRALTERVLALAEEQWLAEPLRQQAHQVHAQTQSIILLFCEGWPKMRVHKHHGWTLLGQEAAPVIEQIVSKHYPPGGQVLRAMMARLPAGCRILRHRDVHPSFSIAHRIHTPLVTNPNVEFIVGAQRVEPREHHAFELDNSLAHEVANNGAAARIHFIFDYAPPT